MTALRMGIAAAMTCLMMLCAGCHTVDDDRIPSVPVNINLGDPGLWNTYGVAGYGQYRYFIRELQQPSNFSFTDRTYTGFGGVLLIGGMDPFTTETNVPLAYDLACPVERRRDVRVRIDPDSFEAVCPDCGSVYDVTMAGGSPVSGRAASEKVAMTRYRCVPQGSTVITGYIITN